MSQDDPTAPDDATAVYHSSTTPARVPFEESIEIPGYRVEKRLGEGGMGAVYLAEDLALGRKVAIKVVTGRIASDPDVRARFLREARLLATVEHPNVVRVHSFGTIGDRPYLVMEYVEGETLASRLSREGAMPVDTALEILREIADALSVAWEKRVIHRDVKPSNILFDTRGRLKVADFGLAKGVDAASTDSSLTQTGYLLGSPHYVAPEQAQGHDVDFRADIYSLGIVLYEMLTGRKPFEAASAMAIVAKHLHESLPPIRAVRKDIPAEIDALLAWLAAKDRNARPASYADLLAALPSEATREITAPRIGPPRRSRRIVAAVMLIAALVLGGSLAWQRLASRASDTVAKKASDGRLVIAVAPFNGVDAESSREGRVMASLVEREIVRRMRDRVKVRGVDETNTAVRDTDAARALGERLGASLVIWGDAWVFRGEAEIQPSLTIIPRGRAGHQHDAHAIASGDPFFEMARPAVRVAMEAPNQIELRKTSAAGIGELAVLAVSTQLLQEQNDPEAALELLSELRPTPDARLQRARSFLHLGRHDDARAELERAIAIDPKHAASRAMLADMALRDHLYLAAAQHLNAAGGPVTAAGGAIYDGKLWVAEQFFDGEQHRVAPTMLAIDAGIGRVLARYWLPGVPVAFTVEENDLVIRYNAAGSDAAPRIETVRFHRGRFDPPRQLPAAVVSRLDLIRPVWVIPRAFLSDVATPRAMLVRKPEFRYDPKAAAIPNGPKTFAELKTALEKEIERDPTQPGHLAYLALAQRALGQHAEAERTIRRAFSDGDPEIPYYQYAWIARQLEALELRQWTDLAYAQALRRRRMLPDPISSTYILERLINAPLTRGAAARSRWAPDPIRHFVLWQRVHALSGTAPEMDRHVFATWARYFESKNDAANAAIARKLERQAVGPDPTKWTAIADVLYPAILAAAVAGALLLLLIVVRSMRAKAVTRDQRIAVIVVIGAYMLFVFVQMESFRRIKAISYAPVGLNDTLASATVIGELENELPDNPRLTFATAVANHLGGRTRRARELYALANDERVDENMIDLRANHPPRHVPPSMEIRRAYAHVPLAQSFEDAASAWTSAPVDDPWERRVRLNSTALGIALVLLLAAGAWLVMRPSIDATRSLATLRAAAAMIAIVFLVAASYGYRKGKEESNDHLPTPGVLTAQFQPGYINTAPLPPLPTFDDAARSTAMRALPMRIFIGSMIGAALLALVLGGPLAWRYFAALSRMRRPMWKRSGASNV